MTNGPRTRRPISLGWCTTSISSLRTNPVSWRSHVLGRAAISRRIGRTWRGPPVALDESHEDLVEVRHDLLAGLDRQPRPCAPLQHPRHRRARVLDGDVEQPPVHAPHLRPQDAGQPSELALLRFAGRAAHLELEELTPEG